MRIRIARRKIARRKIARRKIARRKIARGARLAARAAGALQGVEEVAALRELEEEVEVELVLEGAVHPDDERVDEVLVRLLLEQHALRHLQRDDVALAQLLERVVPLRRGVGDDPHRRVAAVADAHVAHQVRRQRPLRRRLRRLLRCYLLQVLAAAVVVLDGERRERRGELLLEGEGGDVAPHATRGPVRCRATP